MSAAVYRPYGFPRGYHKTAPPLGYNPWNNSKNSPSPARQLLGATQLFNIASVPADLSTLIINTPDGRSVTFQFVYNGSVQSTGIKIPLPLSGASTAAQVQTAIAAVLGAASGIPFGSSSPTVFPWTYLTTGAAQFLISFNVKGANAVPTGTQATITVGVYTASTFGFAAVVPARFGKNYTFLHGV